MQGDTKLQNKDIFYPIVVSVLGHVDHGKTTLLDSIRKTNIATSEKGGITQKIGASQTEAVCEGKKRKITFIDTPGHLAFANMRKQGVSASDIALLLVAANDGVMPQTEEAIEKITEAKIPYIVVFTKTDLESANIERVKQQLIKKGVALEGFGGNIPYIAVSAKTGEKIPDLLDLIVLAWDISGAKKDENKNFYGVVIESKTDKRKGILLTIIIKSGKLKIGDIFFTTREHGKARNLLNSYGKTIKEAFPGDAVEVIGAKELLPIGTIVSNRIIESEKAMTDLSADFKKPVFDFRSFLKGEDKSKFKVILKTEGSGEAEAIKASLPSSIEIVSQGQGEINVSDVLLAKDLGAVIIGFNNEITGQAKALAVENGVFYKIFNIIYELLDELGEAALAFLESGKEEVLGRATILASFEIPMENGQGKVKVMGAKVIEGKITFGDKVKILRAGKEIAKAKIVSLKKGKDDAREIAKGNECGVVVSPQIDFRKSDVLLSHK